MADMEEARARMIAKRFGGKAAGASTGGGGSVRRKKKAAIKSTGGESFFYVARTYSGSILIMYCRSC